MSKRVSKYIASFDYFDKSLIVLSATSGSISIASFGSIFISISISTVSAAPVRIAAPSLSFAFSVTTEII